MRGEKKRRAAINSRKNIKTKCITNMCSVQCTVYTLLYEYKTITSVCSYRFEYFKIYNCNLNRNCKMIPPMNVYIKCCKHMCLLDTRTCLLAYKQNSISNVNVKIAFHSWFSI